MTRGRPPQKALDEALPIAQVRGRLMQFVDGPPFEYDFLFMSDERICCAWVKRTRRIWCTPEEMEAQCAEAIAKYRSIPVPAGLTREIWYWSPYGIFRFFRIGKDVLVEIGRDGHELAMLATKPDPQNNAQKKPARNGNRPVKAKGPLKTKELEEKGKSTEGQPGSAEEKEGSMPGKEKLPDEKGKTTEQEREREPDKNPAVLAGSTGTPTLVTPQTISPEAPEDPPAGFSVGGNPA